MCDYISRRQATMLAWLSPGQWLGFFHGWNRSRVTWTIAAEIDDIRAALDAYAERSSSHFSPSYDATESFSTSFSTWRVFVFTKALRWLDVIDITLVRTQNLSSGSGSSSLMSDPGSIRMLSGDSGSNTYLPPSYPDSDNPSFLVSHDKSSSLNPSRAIATHYTRIEASSYCSSVVPAGCPLAPLLATALFWLPFLDHGENFLHLARLKSALESNLGGVAVSFEEVINPGVRMRCKHFTILTIVFAITLAISLWNMFINDSDNTLHWLSIPISIVTNSLTILTFITYGNGIRTYLEDSASSQFSAAFEQQASMSSKNQLLGSSPKLTSDENPTTSRKMGGIDSFSLDAPSRTRQSSSDYLLQATGDL